MACPPTINPKPSPLTLVDLTLSHSPCILLQGPAPKVLHCDIYVAERFIGWQEKSLVALQQSFDAKAKVCVEEGGGGRGQKRWGRGAGGTAAVV